MAEASNNNPGSPICQYFLNSICRYGDKCRFSHPLPTPPRNGICKFYLRGKCRFGDICWNRHAPDDIGGPTKDSLTTPPSNGSIPSNGPFQHSRDQESSSISDPDPQLCLDFIAGRCTAGYACDLMHGDPCPLCGKPCLDPLDPSQRARHAASCAADARAQRDATEARRRGLDKSCGICLDVVREKPDPTARKFGVLENCDHVFCFECIMRWRKVKNRDVESFTDLSIGKACPECRVPSDFVAPSKFWFATPEEKRKLVSDRRAYLQTKHCKAFRRGDGHCPFGNQCYNLHVLHNGQKVTLPPPSPFPRDLDFVSRLLLLDFWDAPEDFFSSDSDFEDDDLDLLYNLDFEIMNRLEF